MDVASPPASSAAQGVEEPKLSDLAQVPTTTHRRALYGLGAAYVVAFASGGIQLPLTALAMDHVGVGPATVGAMWAARALAGAVMPVLWGLAADRMGSARPLLIASLSIGAALMLWLSTTPAPWVCILIFALYGVFTNPSGSLMDGMTLTALGERTGHFGRWRSFGTLGFGCSTLVVTLLLDRGMLAPLPSSLFPLCALLTGSGAVIVAVFVPHLPRPALVDSRLIWSAFRQPALLGLIACGTVLWASHAAFASFLAPLTQRIGFPPQVIGFTIAAAVVVEAVAMSTSTTFVKLLGARTIVVGAAVRACLRWIFASQTTSPAWFIAVHSLHGLTFGLFFVVITGLIAERAPPELRQASQGLLSSLSFGLGGFAGGLLCGYSLQATVGAEATWLTMAAVAAGAVVVSAAFTRTLSPGSEMAQRRCL